jgi:hypothetical protein
LLWRPRSTAVVNPQISKIRTAFIIGLHGIVHTTEVVGIAAKGYASENADKHHEDYSGKSKFGTPQTSG